MYGSPLDLGYGTGVTRGWTAIWWQGLSGLLISPAKGLLVFSPFLVLALVQSIRSARQPHSLYAHVGLAAWVFALIMSGWWG